MVAPVCLFLSSPAADLSKHPSFTNKLLLKAPLDVCWQKRGREHSANKLVADVSRQPGWGQRGDSG